MTLHEGVAEWLSGFFPSVANHLWQATLFTLLGIIAIRLLKRRPARSRYAVWLIVMAKFALPSVLLVSLASHTGVDLSSLFGSTLNPVQAVPIMAQVAGPVAQFGELPMVEAVYVRAHNELYCVLAAVWLAGLAVMLAQCWKRRKALSALISKARRVDSGKEIDALNRARARVGVKRNIYLVITSERMEPGVWGIRKPVLLLPETIADYLSDAELEAVILHEVVHVARRDNLASLLQTFISCLLWFHPLVWVISRKMLAEREQACDEKVIEISGAAKVYASGILKVCRFCLGFQLAGVSSITGSDLQRRIEQIMANKGNTKPSASHQILVTTVAVAILAFSIAAGLLSPDAIAVPAQSTDATPHGVAKAKQSGQENSGAQQEERAKESPDVTIQIENASGAPVSIRNAKVNLVDIGRGRAGPSTAIPAEGAQGIAPSITVSNDTTRRITGLALIISHPESGYEYGYEHPALSLEPHSSLLIRACMMPYIPGDLSRMKVTVIGVRFDDGTSWGKIASADEAAIAPEPPIPPEPPVGISGAASTAGAPTTGAATTAPVEAAGPDVAIALPEPPEIPFVSALTPSSSSWPSAGSGPDWPSSEVVSEKGKLHRYGGGMIHRAAIRVVQPTYPEQARKAGIAGVVVVEVIVNTNGYVEFARVRPSSAYGFVDTNNPLLEQAALAAARLWQFKPATDSGVPVGMIGELYFRFR